MEVREDEEGQENGQKEAESGVELGLYVNEVFLLDVYDHAEYDAASVEPAAGTVNILSKEMQYQGAMLGRRTNGSTTLEAFSVKTVAGQDHHGQGRGYAYSACRGRLKLLGGSIQR